MDAGRIKDGQEEISSPLGRFSDISGGSHDPPSESSISPMRQNFHRSPLRNQRGETIHEAVNRIKKNLPEKQDKVESRRSRSRERKSLSRDVTMESNLDADISDQILKEISGKGIDGSSTHDSQIERGSTKSSGISSRSQPNASVASAAAIQRTVASGHFVPISGPSLLPSTSVKLENGVGHAGSPQHSFAKNVNASSSPALPQESYNSQYTDGEMSTIEKQRVELQLLMGELKDRDRELNEMVTAHQQQMAACEKDREKYQALVEKCGRREDEIQSRNTQIRGLVKKIRVLESAEQTRLTELEGTKKQLARIVDQHHQAQQRMSELQENELKRKHSYKEMSSTIGRLEAREEELSTLIKLKDKDTLEVQKEVSDLKARLRKLESDVRVTQQKELEAQRQANSWQRKYQSVCKENERIKDNLNQSQQEESHLQEIIDKQRQEVSHMRKQLSFAEERDKRKDELIESHRLKQERTDKELTDLRQLYERQREDLSQLHLSLESTKQLLDQNISPKLHDSTFELLGDLSGLGASFHSVNYADSFGSSPNISASSVIQRVDATQSHNTLDSSGMLLTQKLDGPAGVTQPVPIHSTPIRRFSLSRTTQLIKPTPQRITPVDITGSPKSPSMQLVKPVLQRVPTSTDTGASSPCPSRESSVLSGSGRSVSSPWVKPMAVSHSGSISRNSTDAKTDDSAYPALMVHTAKSAESSSPANVMLKSSSVLASLQKPSRPLSLMQEMEIAERQSSLNNSKHSENHTADNKYFHSPVHGAPNIVASHHNSFNKYELVKRDSKEMTKNHDGHDSFSKRSRSPVESCDNSTISNGDTSASLRDFEAAERECASPCKISPHLSNFQNSRILGNVQNAVANTNSSHDLMTTAEVTNETLKKTLSQSEVFNDTLAGGTAYMPSSYSQFTITSMSLLPSACEPDVASPLDQKDFVQTVSGSKTVTSSKSETKPGMQASSAIFSEYNGQPDSLSSVATMEMHSLLSDSIPTPVPVSSPHSPPFSLDEIQSNNLGSNVASTTGRSCFSLYSERSLDESINSCGNENISIPGNDHNENNNNDSRLIYGSAEVYKVVNTLADPHEAQTNSTNNSTGLYSDRIGWPKIGPTAFNVGPMSPSPVLTTGTSRENNDTAMHRIAITEGRDTHAHSTVFNEEEYDPIRDGTHGAAPLWTSNIIQFNTNINTEYDEKAGIYVNRNVDLPTPSTFEMMSPESISIDVSLVDSEESDAPTSKLQRLLDESREMAACLQRTYQPGA